MLNCRSNNKAFSLLELLVTVAVLSVGIVAILQGISFSARLTGLSGDIVRAVFLAEDKLQELSFIEKQGLIEEIPQEINGAEGKFGWRYNLLLDSDLDLYKLNLEVSWKRSDRQEEVSLATYLK
ncbi:MAG: prepilin-type N-terminal cleavage/methylation domain-containing protein [Candidatus Omnitrophica bacterium]|nr:prepilin-type N-terminal cleavage/methylation domain-containing protein [Candidatus Omnitrophota bacterium]